MSKHILFSLALITMLVLSSGCIGGAEEKSSTSQIPHSNTNTNTQGGISKISPPSEFTLKMALNMIPYNETMASFTDVELLKKELPFIL